VYTDSVTGLAGYESYASDDWVYAMKTPDNKPSRDIKCAMSLGGKTIFFQIDTGASISVMPAMYAPFVTGKARTLNMWNGNKLTSLGTCRTTLKNLKYNKKYNVEFIVVKKQLSHY